MIPREPQPMRMHCLCGGKLSWESRTTWRGARWLGICSQADCGHWTTQLAEGPIDNDGLRHFLLDYKPPHPYVSPWVRLFLGSAVLGWQPHISGCGGCDGRLVMQLRLPPVPERDADPELVVMCLDCGRTGVRFPCFAEYADVFLEPDAWTDPVIALRALKRSLRDRTALAQAGEDDAGARDWEA